MSNTSKIFQKAPVEVPKFSGFDMSHINTGSMKVGTLTPVLVEPLYPADRVSLGFNCNFQLPPMATDFVGKVDVRFEAFFVPLRLCWMGFQKFYNNINVDQYTTPVTRLPKLRAYMESDEMCEYVIESGSLMDYLGAKAHSRVGVNSWYLGKVLEIDNPLPLIAYHLIYDRWYRDKLIQRPLFCSPDEAANLINTPSSPFYNMEGGAENFSAAMLPYRFGPDGVNSEYMNNLTRTEPSSVEPDPQDFKIPKFADGSNIFQLRQRNWEKDYFTAATPLPQAGNEASVEFTVVDSSGSFSIGALRQANTLQRFCENRNLAGGEYDSQIFVEWGIRPADAVLQHPILLGSSTVNVYNRSVLQTANGEPLNQDGSSNTRNPFDSVVGASFGKSQALGSNSLVSGFQAKEHGFLFVIASLVPHAFYGTGTRKYLSYNEFGDFPNPKLAGLGNQEINAFELVSESYFSATKGDVFGYADRFSERKWHADEVHGLLRDGENLQHFAIQRSFYEMSLPVISSDFIKINTNAMDNVTAVSGDLSKYGCWYEIAFQEHITGAFPEYSIPTLGEEKHTKTILVDRGGKRL